jgi:hypothetical protein
MLQESGLVWSQITVGYIGQVLKEQLMNVPIDEAASLNSMKTLLIQRDWLPCFLPV